MNVEIMVQTGTHGRTLHSVQRLQLLCINIYKKLRTTNSCKLPKCLSRNNPSTNQLHLFQKTKMPLNSNQGFNSIKNLWQVHRQSGLV